MNFEEKEKKKDGIIEKNDGIIEKNDDPIEKKIFKWLFIVMWLVLLGAIGLVVAFLFRYSSSNNLYSKGIWFYATYYGSKSIL